MPRHYAYALSVRWSPEDREFVATYAELPGLSGLGETEAEAIEELKVATRGWLAHLAEQGLPAPSPSGMFVSALGAFTLICTAHAPSESAGSPATLTELTMGCVLSEFEQRRQHAE